MSISASDIKWRLTLKTGSSGEAATQPDVNQSLGKYASNTDLTDATLHALFDAVSGDENAASTVDYRAVAILNKHATLTWQGVKAWLASEVAGGASIAIGLDPVGVAASTAILGTSIATEASAPSGVSFSSPTTKAGGLSVGDVPAGSGFILWIRRTAANTSAVDADGVTPRVEGDSAA